MSRPGRLTLAATALFALAAAWGIFLAGLEAVRQPLGPGD